MLGLTYWVTVANFIMRALESSRIHDMLQRRALKMRNLLNAEKDSQFIQQYTKSAMKVFMQVGFAIFFNSMITWVLYEVLQALAF